MLSAVSVLSMYTYGLRSFVIILISVLTAVTCKKIGEELLKSDYPGGDLSGAVIGLMLALMLPSSVPYYVPFFGALFAVAVCLLPFGTAKNSPFVPAAAAMCFLTVCFGDKVFSYPQIVNGITIAEKTGISITNLLASGTSVKLNSAVVLEIFTGQMPSAMGTGFIIMLLGALVFLLIRFPKNALPAIMFLASSSVFAMVLPRVSTGALTSLTMEICGGSLMFCAVFFMTYPSVVPTRLFSSLVWGAVSGLVCMAFRYFGKYEDSLIFGILLMNGTAGLFDELPLTKFEKKKMDDEVPFEDTTENKSLVPEAVLSEIPDITEEEIQLQDDGRNDEADGEPIAQEDLHTAFNAENEIDETSRAPFAVGGDGDER